MIWLKVSEKEPQVNQYCKLLYVTQLHKHTYGGYTYYQELVDFYNKYPSIMKIAYYFPYIVPFGG